MVYDFSTMQRSDFDADGWGLHDVAVGIAYSQYVGFVYGLRSDSPLLTITKVHSLLEVQE